MLLGAVRTPNGRYGGSLRQVGAVELGVLAAREAVARAGVRPELVEEVVFSNCRQAGNGPNPGRQVALRAGFPQETPAQTINMACASGLKAIHLAQQAILSGGADIAVAVAAESMSTMPYLAPSSLRWGGVKRGDIVLADGWRDGGTDPVCGLNMGQTAERIAERFGVSRADQDAWSLRSHQRVAEAWREGRFAGQVVEVPLEDGDVLDRDEGFRPDTSAERLAKLKPSFVEGGTVTAGNASQMADGAAAIVLASAAAVSAHGLVPQGKMRSFSAVGVDPAVMGVGPSHAIPKALDTAGVKPGDLDLVEINEAFAAQIVQNVRALALDEERVNVNGGGIALGHPTGQSGCRLVVSLLHELARRDETLGVASLCVGGGQGVAAVIERVA
ncbi:thiolase family protein [Amycolatopsis acidicola]|uniref:Probable acetyl-CoA acetyltransferase n=2 Tax=Amycolatopsis acidicola TaxID=2596893 RepID=A0A5N0V0K8_9PSEU|nr:thiolase family protein [Amycolatopsis acidicola]